MRQLTENNASRAKALLERGTEYKEASKVYWNGNVTGPKTSLGIENTIVGFDTLVHNGIIGKPTEKFAQEHRNLN